MSQARCCWRVHGLAGQKAVSRLLSGHPRAYLLEHDQRKHLTTHLNLFPCLTPHASVPRTGSRRTSTRRPKTC